MTIACGIEEYRLAKNIHNNVNLVCNGIDLSFIETLNKINNNCLKKEKLRIGNIGRTKFPQHNVELFNYVAKEFYERCQFIWIGARKEDINIFSYVEKTGWIDHEEAIKRLAEIDIVLHLTNYDGLSYSLLEAMALHKPVIAWDNPASRAVIQDGYTGFLVSNRNILLEKVNLLIKNAELRRSIGDSAYEVVANKYSAIAMAEGYMNIYQGLCKRCQNV